MEQCGPVSSLELRKAEFFGRIGTLAFREDLYRLPNGSWLLHTWYTASMEPPFARVLTPKEATDWVLDLVRSRSAPRTQGSEEKREIKTVPECAVLWDDPIAQRFSGRQVCSGPPPLNFVEVTLPPESKSARNIQEAQKALLESFGLPLPDDDTVDLENALARLLWPTASAENVTQGFKSRLHDELLQVLRGILDTRLIGRPKNSVLQSLQDAGCDLLTEWDSGPKCGLQLKSHFDIDQKDFAAKTLSQIQDSKRHGLQRLYVLLAGDLTDASQVQKVRAFHGRVSQMNDAYVKVIPPERLWTVLFG